MRSVKMAWHGMTWHDFKIQDDFLQCSAREQHDGDVAWLVSVSGWWTWVVGQGGRRLAGGAKQVKHKVRNLPLVSFRPYEQTWPKKALPGWSHLWATDQRWLLTSVARCDSVKEVLTATQIPIFKQLIEAADWWQWQRSTKLFGDLVTQCSYYSYNSYSCLSRSRKTQVRPGRRAAYLGLQLMHLTSSHRLCRWLLDHSPRMEHISKVEKALTTWKVTRMAKVWVRAKVTKMAKGMSFGVMPKENAKDRNPSVSCFSLWCLCKSVSQSCKQHLFWRKRKRWPFSKRQRWQRQIWRRW